MLTKTAAFLLLSLLGMMDRCSPEKEKPSEIVIQHPVTAKAQEQKKYVRVKYVVDGDTFHVINEHHQVEKIRLLGIDAPETRESAKKHIGFYGKESSRYLRDLLMKEKKVYLEYDYQKKDQYGRTLAYVYLSNGDFVNGLMLENGYAKVFVMKPNLKYAKEFRAMEARAKQKKLGMWSN